MARPKTGSIQNVGKNKYRIRWTDSSGKRYSKYLVFRNITEAKEYLNKISSQQNEYLGRGNIGFRQFAENYLKSKKIELGVSTYDDYEGMTNKHIIPYFNEIKLHSIHAGDITTFRAHLSTKKGKNGCLSNRTINKILIFLHGMVQDAVDDDRLLKNPVILKKHKLDSDSKNDFFTLEEMKRFLSNVPNDYKPFFLVAWHTGMRLGELIGLKWEDINWDQRTIRIKRSIYQGKGHVETPPKTKSGDRIVYMTNTCSLMLKCYKAKSKVHSIKGYVFERNGNPFRKDGIVRSQMRQSREKSGLRHTQTFHSIRHGLITLIRGKFPEYIVKKWVGHSIGKYDVTDIYTHTTHEEMRRYADLLDEMLTGGNNLQALKA